MPDIGLLKAEVRWRSENVEIAKKKMTSADCRFRIQVWDLVLRIWSFFSLAGAWFDSAPKSV
jgi:hypothetical protein